MAPSLLTPSQTYAVGSLFALALRQAQIHQTQPLGSFPVDEDGEAIIPDRSSSGSRSSSSSSASDGDDPQLWTHESHGLLRPVFSFFGIEKKAWPGIEETAASSPANHHVGALLRMIIEEGSELSHESLHQALALRKAVDTMAMSLEATSNSTATAREERREYENQCLKRSLSKEYIDGTSKNFDGLNLSNAKSNTRNNQLDEIRKDEALFGNTDDNYQLKVVVLFELLSACIADSSKEMKHSHIRRGYDSRHRVALRLLSTWFDVPWNKFEAMEVMIACSAIAAVKDLKGIPDDSQANESKWSKWKRGGIIGAAALTGGTLLAITGGLAAPAIAAGFGALAPTLGTLVPVIGASGFAAAAGAAGSVAGSVAVAASFGAAGAGLTGTKVARRMGSIEEFEFMAIGKNHKQGCLAVGILISGFVFETEDFVRPWEHLESKLERYAIQWESQILIAVSTAIQDLITSSVATELMKQGAMMTVLSALVTALAWPAVLLSATSLIDGKWTMAVDRSDKAGKLLAEVLLKGLQGNRPVTLYGFSLGARVIFKCLQFLAESGDNEGLVERVVLLGAPISVDGEPWISARKMVAGRFVNVYSSNDWFLGITFRASLLTQGLAGIQPVNIPGIENVDVTEYIDGHSSYTWATQCILEQLELDTYYPVFTAYSS